MKWARVGVGYGTPTPYRMAGMATPKEPPWGGKYAHAVGTRSPCHVIGRTAVCAANSSEATETTRGLAFAAARPAQAQAHAHAARGSRIAERVAQLQRGGAQQPPPARVRAVGGCRARARRRRIQRQRHRRARRHLHAFSQACHCTRTTHAYTLAQVCKRDSMRGDLASSWTVTAELCGKSAGYKVQASSLTLQPSGHCTCLKSIRPGQGSKVKQGKGRSARLERHRGAAQRGVALGERARERRPALLPFGGGGVLARRAQLVARKLKLAHALGQRCGAHALGLNFSKPPTTCTAGSSVPACMFPGGPW